MVRAKTVPALVIVMLVAMPAAAFAHAGNPNYRSEIDKVTPTVPDVSFEVLDYDSYMQLLDPHGHEVTIYGYEGEPYARILKRRHRAGERTLSRRSTSMKTASPKSRSPRSPTPKRRRMEDVRSLRHLPLARPPDALHAPTLPPQVKDTSGKTKIFNYEIPIRVEGRKGAIDGTLFWVGPADTSKTPFIVAGIVLVLAGGALVLIVRRRRRDGGDDGHGDGPKPGQKPATEAW